MDRLRSRSISRRSLLAGTVAASAVAVSGLGTRPAAAQDKTQITWLTNSDWPLDQVIAGFEADNPDIEVVPEPVGADAITQQIQVKLGAKSADPDVFSVDVPNTPSYGFQGWLAPLDDAFTAEILGTERAGNGVLIGPGLVLTIGYLITEADSVWLTFSDGRSVPGHVLGYDQTTGFGLVQALGSLGLPALELGDSDKSAIGDRVLFADGVGHSVRAAIVAKQIGFKNQIKDKKER